MDGKGKVDPLIEIAEICQYMGWTWFDYLETPKSFLEIIKIKKRIEAEFANYQNLKWQKQNLKQF